jgi:hypothetical protein
MRARITLKVYTEYCVFGVVAHVCSLRVQFDFHQYLLLWTLIAVAAAVLLQHFVRFAVVAFKLPLQFVYMLSITFIKVAHCSASLN